MFVFLELGRKLGSVDDEISGSQCVLGGGAVLVVRVHRKESTVIDSPML